MNRQLLLMVFVLVLSAGTTNAQTLRHVKGQQSVEVLAGYAGMGGLHVSGNYLRYLPKNFFWKAGAAFEQGQKNGIKISDIRLAGQFGWNFFDVKETLYFNLLGGLAFSNVNTKGVEVSNQKPISIFGTATLEAECFLSRKSSALLGFQQGVNLYGNTGHYYNLYLGYRFTF